MICQDDSYSNTLNWKFSVISVLFDSKIIGSESVKVTWLIAIQLNSKLKIYFYELKNYFYKIVWTILKRSGVNVQSHSKRLLRKHWPLKRAKIKSKYSNWNPIPDFTFDSKHSMPYLSQFTKYSMSRLCIIITLIYEMVQGRMQIC